MPRQPPLDLSQHPRISKSPLDGVPGPPDCKQPKDGRPHGNQRLEDEPFTFTVTEVTEQYRFRLFTSAVLERAEDGSELLDLGRLVGWGTYDAALSEGEGRDPAVDTAMDMIIEEIVDRTTASW